LFSTSLDKHLKVYDVKTYNVVHTSPYPSPILSAGLSPNNSHLVVGMVDGLLSIRHRVTRPKEEVTAVRSVAYTPYQSATMQPQRRLKEFDRLLRKFRYRESVQSAVEGGNPNAIVSLFSELLRRNVLKNALAGRDAEELVPLLEFIHRHITNPRHSMVLIHVTNVLLDIYAPVLGQAPSVDGLFMKIADKIKLEIHLQEKLTALNGGIDLIVNAASIQVPTV
jgi:U3 small nucleolar RNA-associated protein 15